jgi:hypothetical protein
MNRSYAMSIVSMFFLACVANGPDALADSTQPTSSGPNTYSNTMSFVSVTGNPNDPFQVSVENRLCTMGKDVQCQQTANYVCEGPQFVYYMETGDCYRDTSNPNAIIFLARCEYMCTWTLGPNEL